LNFLAALPYPIIKLNFKPQNEMIFEIHGADVEYRVVTKVVDDLEVQH